MASATTTTKVSAEMVKPFKGEGDVIAWIKKIQLVAKLQKVSDLASFIPLFLEGDALALYLEMSEDDQTNAESIIARLKEAFTEGAFVAFAKLSKIKWTGQPVDVFANEIRRLAGLAGLRGEGLESVVRLTFVNGFPDRISVALQQVDGVLTKPVSDLINVARIYCTCRNKCDDVHVTAVARVVETPKKDSGPSTGRGFKPNVKVKCFRCGGPHFIKFCEEKVRCFKCNNTGHIASQCDVDQKTSENAQGQGNE